MTTRLTVNVDIDFDAHNSVEYRDADGMRNTLVTVAESITDFYPGNAAISSHVGTLESGPLPDDPNRAAMLTLIYDYAHGNPVNATAESILEKVLEIAVYGDKRAKPGDKMDAVEALAKLPEGSEVYCLANQRRYELRNSKLMLHGVAMFAPAGGSVIVTRVGSETYPLADWEIELLNP